MTFAKRRAFAISRAKRFPLGSRLKTYSRLHGTFYWKVRTPDGWRYEHRVIMEELLGRKLATVEHVHHRNGDGLDNHPENLRVLSAAEHMRLHHLGTKNPRKASRKKR